jgi:hypothetical protein
MGDSEKPAEVLVLSGKGVDALDLKTFTKAFVASLVARDLLELRPGDQSTRRGFAGVVKVLDERRRALQDEGGPKDLLRGLTKVANELRPSNTGAFDGFEAALRQAQLTFTTSPNPDYDDIVFSVPKAYAEATVGALPPEQRSIINQAVDAFVDTVG